MKTSFERWTIIFHVCIGTFFAGLLFVLSQLFPVFFVSKSDTIVYEEFFSFFILTLLIVILAVVWIVGSKYLQQYKQQLESVTKTTIELMNGNYKARAIEVSDSYNFELSKALNQVALKLQELSANRQFKKEELNTLIETIGSALVMVNRDSQVSLWNKTFQNLFQISVEKNEVVHFSKLNVPKEIHDFVDLILITDKPKRKQISFIVGEEWRKFDIYGAPVLGEHGKWLGVVIVLHEITELTKLEQIRKDFVANVSHELRTPITSIKGFSETLIDGAYKNEETLLQFLGIMHEESIRLELLIKDLLELSKAEQDGLNMMKSKLTIKSVLDQAVNMLMPKIKEKNIKIDFRPQTEGNIEADLNRLMQIVVNLLSNAITYSPENTTIYLTIREDETSVYFSVRDEGIGIKNSEIPRIFERFYRVDRARSRNSGGTGLGLAIVKHLVKAHKGKIRVKSTVGEGTQFTIQLPKS